MIAALAMFAVRCGGGSPGVMCQMQPCGNDPAKTYQICAHANGDLSYQFGGQSCTCASSNSVQCNGCAAQVVAYCEGGGVGGTGGAGGSGGTGGSTGGACTATFSGAFSSTYSPCAVTITAVPGNEWTVGTAGNDLPGTPFTWSGMSFALSGSPAPGTYDQDQALGASDMVTEQNSSDPPEWLAGAGNGASYGSASLTITSLGPPTDVNGTTLYRAPHGSWTGTLVDQNPHTAQGDVMQTITF